MASPSPYLAFLFVRADWPARRQLATEPVRTHVLLEDAASGDYNREPSVSSALHEAVARQLQIEPEQLPIENVRPMRDNFETKTVKEKTHFTRATVCVNS